VVVAALADLLGEVAVSAAVARGVAGNPMRTKDFLSKLDHDRIVKAIQEEEARSSGQIGVYIQRGELPGDPVEAAQRRFLKSGMHKTSHRNAVLIFVAPRAHKFAVIGDQGIHIRCGNELWNRVVQKMGEHFKQEHFSSALVDAIRDLGDVLAEQFPHDPGAKDNELPDDVVEG
jgi:uncharacterized membrane protein